MKKTSLFIVVAGVALSSAAQAQTTTYDFSQLDGDYTSPTTTLGIATFSSPYDSYNQIPPSADESLPTGELQFGSGGGLYSNITSNEVLSSEGYVGSAVSSGFTPVTGGESTYTNSVTSPYYAPAVLNISFSQAQSAISFDFATSDFFNGDGGDYLTLTTNTGATGTFTAALNGNDFYDEGSVDFSSTPFTSVTIRAYDSVGDQDLVLGDLVTAVPEPSSWALGLLAIGTALYLRRRALRA
jgi:hypothetical protein